jgi:TRAP-type C4-dicarboxylate transport system permease large subunit
LDLVTWGGISLVFMIVLIVMGVHVGVSMALVVLRNPALGPRGPKSTWKERFVALYRIKDVVLLVILVIGGMLTGFFTVNEGSAVGVAGALTVATFRRTLNFPMLERALLDAGRTTAMIFGYFLAVAAFPLSG